MYFFRPGLHATLLPQDHRTLSLQNPIISDVEYERPSYLRLFWRYDISKGGFFQDVLFVFQIFKIKIFQITILSLKFEFGVYCYWRIQVQDSGLEYFFWRFGALKNTLHFLIKATFSCYQNLVFYQFDNKVILSKQGHRLLLVARR